MRESKKIKRSRRSHHNTFMAPLVTKNDLSGFNQVIGHTKLKVGR